VHSFLIPLFKGLIAVFAISGTGKLLLGIFGIRNLPWYWRMAFTLLAGQAAVFVAVEAVLLLGAGAAPALRFLTGFLLGIALIGHVFFSRAGAGKGIGEIFRADKIITAVLLLAVFTNLVVALAPSTKIDELYYHMLTPKRIVEDGGLRFYLLPIESAIAPQMHYQIALSLAHASGAPDAGNVLSWGYSASLSLFIIGFLTAATKNCRLSLLCGAVCSVGIYATVWHVTGGAHALGDLATVVALAGILRPAILIDALGPYRYTFILSTAAAIAASTKLSLVPLSLVVAVLIVISAIRKKIPGTKMFNAIALALLPWIALHLPLMIWTYAESGSFWGPMLANFFGQSVFPSKLLQFFADLQAFNPGDFFPLARYAAAGFSPLFFISIGWILWTALRGNKTGQVTAVLLLFQCALVAWKFHFDFRFLGGMEYVAVLAAVLTVANTDSGAKVANGWPRIGAHVVNSRGWILLFAAVPWLGYQIYYARPFAGVVTGYTTRSEFVERYVALTHDFEMLDRMLPSDAVLYIGDGRLPNFYAPRPVVLTPLDLRGRNSVYRLTILPEEDVEEIDATSSLKCGTTIYQNEQAVIETYRTPGEAPHIGPVKVQSCRIQGSTDAP
jgi:hypothetical protein